MKATPSRVGMSQRSPPSAHLRPDQGWRERRAQSEADTMSSEGGYNFRRVAIRRKFNLSYLPPGTPRPWSRSLSHQGWAETATFRGQAQADAPGKCLRRERMGRSVDASEGRTEHPSGARGLPAAKGASRGDFPRRLRLASYLLTYFVPSLKGPSLGRNPRRAELVREVSHQRIPEVKV